MSTNRVHRLLRLLALLQSGRSYTADELARELSASRRTFFRDLKLLDAAGVPFSYDAKQRAYTIDHSFFLPSLDLTLDEALAILLVTRRFISRHSVPTFEPAARAAMKVEGSLPTIVQDYCGRMLEGVSVKFPPMVDSSRVEKIFSALQQAHSERRKVRIRYDSYYERATIGSVVRPYRLHFVNRAWYLIAHSESHDAVRTFKLDRITSVKLLRETYEPDPNFSIDDYFGLAWCMIPEGTVHHVRLRFLPKVAGNVEEVSWHKTQRFSVESDGSCTFEVDVDGLAEITWWILGYGDQVIVEEPAELRERIRKIAENMCRLAEPIEARLDSADSGATERV